LCKFYADAGGKQQIQRQLLLVQYKQQANPLLSKKKNTPLVISKNDKNKQQTNMMPTQTGINLIDRRSSEPLKKLKTSRIP
jgi:hypothetical protein